MNEKNFNSISQFEVPKEWIDTALTVPATHTRKPFPLIKLTRTLAAVASFVIVCGLSIALYFITDDSSIPPVKEPIVTESQFGESSDYTGIFESSYNINESGSDISGETQVLSGLHGQINENNAENSTNSHPEPNEKPQKPTENESDDPTNPDLPEPSEKETNPSEPIPPTQEATPPNDPPLWENPTETPTYRPPFVEPTDDPIEAPTEEPTESPTVKPTVKPTVTPTENPTKPDYSNVEIYALIGENRVAAAKTIYCALYDSNGKLLGNSNLFDSSHIAVKGPTSGGRTYVSYYPYRYFDIPVTANYTCVFYNEKGEEMWRNSCYLIANV